MPRRTYADVGYRARRLRLLLSNEQWEHIEAMCKRAPCTVEAYIEVAIKREMGQDLALLHGQRPGVYYDAQGGEHEEADVR